MMADSVEAASRSLPEYTEASISNLVDKIKMCIRDSYSAIRPGCLIINGASPVALLKAIRNKQEIAGIHAAMQRDGPVPMCRWRS